MNGWQVAGRVPPRRRSGEAAPGPGGLDGHPVTVSIDAGPPGPAVADDFAGLSFERSVLDAGHAGVPGYLFSPGNTALVRLFGNAGLRSLRIGGGTVDQLAPAGTGSDGFTGIDSLFAFAAEAGVRVIYTLRLLSPAANPVRDLDSVNASVAGYIWGRYREHVASFAIGNEPDWHAFHTHAENLVDPAVFEEVPGVPGTAYRSYLTRWRSLAEAVRAAAPGAPLSGPDTGAYTTLTYSPDADTGVSWTERFAADTPAAGPVADITQHHYPGADPGAATADQAIGNMLSPEWVNGAAIGTQPPGITYIPYPWLYRHNLAAVAAAGLRYRLTEANDHLGGVPGASNALASALWALDYLHWWAAHGAAGVNFHNRQWLFTSTIVPSPAGSGSGYAITPKGYGIKAFALGSAGHVRPVRIRNPDGLNLTAYCTGTAAEDYVTIINKTHAKEAAQAAVTIALPGPGPRSAEVMTLAGREPGNAASTSATLGGAAITGDTAWDGRWSVLKADPRSAIALTVHPATAVIIKAGR
ncbi:MAG TPA: hypothetical protein VKS82_14130 [Streptosporangiaceae bacterium]|nr:hypothetical protein [Streptosporangiaceae bacterium]